MVLFVIWILFSFLVASMGNDRKIGFNQALILSVLLSPLIGAIIVLLSKKKLTSHDEER